MQQKCDHCAVLHLNGSACKIKNNNTKHIYESVIAIKLHFNQIFYKSPCKLYSDSAPIEILIQNDNNCYSLYVCIYKFWVAVARIVANHPSNRFNKWINASHSPARTCHRATAGIVYRTYTISQLFVAFGAALGRVLTDWLLIFVVAAACNTCCGQHHILHTWLHAKIVRQPAASACCCVVNCAAPCLRRNNEQCNQIIVFN